MSRPRFIPTDEQRRTVKLMSAYGIKQEEIAKMVGLRSSKSLRKHFRQELDRGTIEATAQVSQTLYKMATSGKHPAATIFLAQDQGGLAGDSGGGNATGSASRFHRGPGQ